MHVGDAEHYYAAEAALIAGLEVFPTGPLREVGAGNGESTMELQRNAAAEFRKRAAEGRLPTPIDPEGHVAQFIGTDFAKHRFSYADA